MRPEVPLTPSPEHRRRLLYADHHKGLAAEAPELSRKRSATMRKVEPMPNGCYPAVAMFDDELRSATIVNVTCDHGASATEVTFVEQHRDSAACIRAMERLFMDRHGPQPPPSIATAYAVEDGG